MLQILGIQFEQYIASHSMITKKNVQTLQSDLTYICKDYTNKTIQYYLKGIAQDIQLNV